MTEVVLSGLTGDGKDHRYGSFRFDGDEIKVNPPNDSVLLRILRKPIPVGGSGTWVRADKEPEAWMKALPLQYRSAYLQAWEAPESATGNISSHSKERNSLTIPRVAPTRQKSLLHSETKAIVSGYDSMGRRYCRDHGRSIPCGQAASTEQDERKRADARTSAKPRVSVGDSLGIGIRTGKPVRDPSGGPAGQVSPPNVSFGCDTSEAMTEVAGADGWEVIRDHLLNLPDAPELQSLATEGISHDPMTLAQELEDQVAAEGDSDVGLILNAMLDLLGENPEATQAMVEGGHLDTAGRDEEEQEPAEKVDLVTDILAGTFGEEELKEAAEDNKSEEEPEPVAEEDDTFPYERKSLLWYDGKSHNIGEVWQGPSGRYFTRRQDGRVIPAKNPNATAKPTRKRGGATQPESGAVGGTTETPATEKKKRATPEEKKKQIEDMVERIKGLRERHNHTAKDVDDLAIELGKLTVRQLSELKRHKDLDFSASGRTKPAYARRVAERALGRPAMESPTSPSPAPSMRGVATTPPPQEEQAQAPEQQQQRPPAPMEEPPPQEEEASPEPVAEQPAPEPERQQPSPEIGTAPTGEPVVDQGTIDQQQPQEEQPPTPEPAVEAVPPEGETATGPETEAPPPEPEPDNAAQEVAAELPPESAREQSRDQKLVAGIKRNDPYAWSDLVTTYQRRLTGFIRGKIKDPGAVEDIMQESYVSMLSGLGTFDPAKGSLRNFLFTIAFRRCNDYMRKKGRSKEESGAGGDFGDEGDVFSRTADTSAQSPEEIAIETETAQRRTATVRRAVDTISREWQSRGKGIEAQIWSLSWDKKVANKDIAAQLGVSEQKVANVGASARKRMAALLKEYDPQEFNDDEQ